MHQIEAQPDGTWLYRGWTLVQQPCGGFKCWGHPDGAQPVWYAEPPYELNYQSFARIADRANMESDVGAMFAISHVVPVPRMRDLTIQAKIDRFENALADMRREAWEEYERGGLGEQR